MKMTKQQAISLKLAQWLGRHKPFLFDGKVVYGPDEMNLFSAPEFNPFANSTEGRAQFAECVIKAGLNGAFCISRFMAECHIDDVISVNEHDSTDGGVVATALEAIYYAIGGAPDAWELPTNSIDSGRE